MRRFAFIGLCILFVVSGLFNIFTIKTIGHDRLDKAVQHQREAERNIERKRGDISGKPDSLKRRELDSMITENEQAKRQVLEAMRALGIK